MSIKVAVLGAKGRMGAESVKAISGTSDAPIEAAGNSFDGQMVKDGNKLKIYYNDESRHGAIGSFEISGLSTVRELVPLVLLPIRIPLEKDTSIIKYSKNKPIIVYPNPFNNNINIEINNAYTLIPYRVIISDFQGRIVLDQVICFDDDELDTTRELVLGDINKGIYLMNIFEDGVIKSQHKIIKQ